MATIRGIVCATGLGLLCLAGCESTQLSGFFALKSDGNGQDRVVAASLDSVAQSAQATLTNMGMTAVVNKQGETVRIASKTARGALFTLVLNRQSVNGVERTRARIEWADAKEDPVGGQLLAALEMVGKG
jgi:hypothetical protein